MMQKKDVKKWWKNDEMEIGCLCDVVLKFIVWENKNLPFRLQLDNHSPIVRLDSLIPRWFPINLFQYVQLLRDHVLSVFRLIKEIEKILVQKSIISQSFRTWKIVRTKVDDYLSKKQVIEVVAIFKKRKVNFLFENENFKIWFPSSVFINSISSNGYEFQNHDSN